MTDGKIFLNQISQTVIFSKKMDHIFPENYMKNMGNSDNTVTIIIKVIKNN